LPAGHAVFDRQGFLRNAPPGTEAFSPGKIPFPLLHIDTSYKFPEMIEFRDAYAREIAPSSSCTRIKRLWMRVRIPFSLGTQKCCGLLKTKIAALMLSLKEALTLRSRRPAG